MPVGTQATVKATTHNDLENLGYRLILANTYHLFLRPGSELIASLGGLHGFSTWKHNFLTDSGGFQVFSLAPFRKILEEGVRFRSHIDGTYHVLTPERVVSIQKDFNSDIQMALDVCTSYGIEKKEAQDAHRTTILWAQRARAEWAQHRDTYPGSLFGIVQGNFYFDLRKESVDAICELDLPGVAIGGLSVGEPFQVFEEFLAYTAELLPENKPRYVMGIGTPEYIFSAVENGIDMFDCVFPTRAGRNGLAFTSGGRIALKNAQWTGSDEPLDTYCCCSTCRRYSKAYLRHLFQTREILGPVLVSHHNLAFLSSLMERIRNAIATETFIEFKKEFMTAYTSRDKA
jgi:queuine tRNA-ribosyltransferase